VAIHLHVVLPIRLIHTPTLVVLGVPVLLSQFALDIALVFLLLFEQLVVLLLNWGQSLLDPCARFYGLESQFRWSFSLSLWLNFAVCHSEDFEVPVASEQT
jgi:hypothetical protein